MRASLLIGLVIGAWAASPAHSQATLWSVDGGQDDHFGQALAGLGDVSGDGVPDVAIGVPGLDTLHVRSGATGGYLYDVGGPSVSQFGELIVSVGDVDGDGLPDFGVGGSQGPSASGDAFAGAFWVVSGAQGDTLFVDQGSATVARMGLAAAGLGDVDLDGVPDFAYSERKPVSTCYVVSGATGQTLDVLSWPQPGNNFVRVLGGGSDLDNDGVPDLVVGRSAFPSSGTVTAFSGASLGTAAAAQLFHTTLQSSGGIEDMTLALPGDVDGDGRGDVAIGLPYADAGALVQTGLVRLLDADGLTLFDVPGLPAADDRFGHSLAALGDVDGDGRGDLAVAGRFPLGRASVLSGVDGSRLFSSVLLGSGSAVAGPGDLDGDGVPDLLNSNDGSIFGSGGEVWAIPGGQGQIEEQGASCDPSGGEGPELVVIGAPSAGGHLVTLSSSSVDAPGALLIGLPAAPTPLPNGCSVNVWPVLVSIPLTLVSIPAPWFGANIDQQWFVVPPTAAGLDLAVQLFTKVGGNLAASRTVVVRVQ